MADSVRDIASILLVDDVPANLTALEAILAPLGQRLVKAESGRQALKALLHEDFACILLDVQMPGLDGFDTAALIKARPRSQHVPILFITAFSRDEMHVDQGYAAGAVDYIVKPFNPDILRTKVAVFVDLFLQMRRFAQHDVLMRDREREVMEREARERSQRSGRSESMQARHVGPIDSLVAVNPSPMAVVAADGRVVSANERFAALIGADPDAISGRRLTEVGGAGFERGIREALHRGGEVHDVLVRPRVAAGVPAELDVTFARLDAPAGLRSVAVFVSGGDEAVRRSPGLGLEEPGTKALQ